MIRRASAVLPVSRELLDDMPRPCFVHTRPSPLCEDGFCRLAGELAGAFRVPYGATFDEVVDPDGSVSMRVRE